MVRFESNRRSGRTNVHTKAIEKLPLYYIINKLKKKVTKENLV